MGSLSVSTGPPLGVSFPSSLVHFLDLVSFLKSPSHLTLLCLSVRLLPEPFFARHAIMIPKGYRLSFSHLVFYISTFIITTQLWSIWRQSSHGYVSYVPRHWDFDADVHANVHTLSHEQCDSAFPKLYHSLDEAVSRRQGRKVHIRDIEISEGRCMLRVMVYQGEVRVSTAGAFPQSRSQPHVTALRCRRWQARKMLCHQWQRTRTHPRYSCPN